MSDNTEKIVRQGKDLGGLQACGLADFKSKARDSYTGWGLVSVQRHLRGISRKALRLKKQGRWVDPMDPFAKQGGDRA